MVSSLMFTTLNVFLCAAGAWMCMCRMTKMSKSTTKRSIRAQYVVWFSLFCADSLSWAYGEPVTFIQLTMTTAIVVHLAIGFVAWHREAPMYTRKLAT